MIRIMIECWNSLDIFLLSYCVLKEINPLSKLMYNELDVEIIESSWKWRIFLKECDYLWHVFLMTFYHWWSINRLAFSQRSVRVGTGQVLVSWPLQLLEPPLSCPAHRYRLRGGGRSTVLWEGLREVLRAALRQVRKRNHAGECYTETEMSFWWNFHHCLHRKLSLWQLSVQPVMEISSKWYFRFSVIVSFHKPMRCFDFEVTCHECITVTSSRARWRLRSPVSLLFT